MESLIRRGSLQNRTASFTFWDEMFILFQAEVNRLHVASELAGRAGESLVRSVPPAPSEALQPDRVYDVYFSVRLAALLLGVSKDEELQHLRTKFRPKKG